MSAPAIHYFRDDHNRTLRVVVGPTGHVSLALIDAGSGDAVNFPKDHNPVKSSGIEHCSLFEQNEKDARNNCPLFEH